MAAAVSGSVLVAGLFFTICAAAAAAAPTAAAAGLDFCAERKAAVRLAAGTAESSLRLRLPAPPPSPLPLLQPSCRLEVAAPAYNYLRVDLAPAPYDGGADDASPDDDDDDEDADLDDEVDRSRDPIALMVKIVEDLSSVVTDGDIRSSCTLALHSEGKLVVAVDLCDAAAVSAARAQLDFLHPNVTISWTPPGVGRTLRVGAVTVTAARKGAPTDNLCTARTVQLAAKGVESGVVLELRDDRRPEDRVGPCRVTVAAPPTHWLSLLLVKTTPTPDSDSSEAVAKMPKQSCELSVILGCSAHPRLLSANLCDSASAAASALHFTELLPGNVTLEWTPPPSAQLGSQEATTVVLTAIGKGEMCSRREFFPCGRRPRHQMLCVAAEFACDGRRNCPMAGDDEDATQCRSSAGLIAEVPAQARPSWSGTRDAKEPLLENVNLWTELQNHSYDTKGHHDAIPDTLSNYGPWGYLMLGMLVCGAFLMLCGLWECCCRTPKASPSAPHPTHTPTTVLMPQLGSTGGVLVLDSDLDDDPSRPPAYDDLDQPPAYVALFPPGQPKDDVAAVVVLAAPPPLAPVAVNAPDADGVASLQSAASTSSMATASTLAPS